MVWGANQSAKCAGVKNVQNLCKNLCKYFCTFFTHHFAHFCAHFLHIFVHLCRYLYKYLYRYLHRYLCRYLCLNRYTKICKKCAKWCVKNVQNYVQKMCTKMCKFLCKFFFFLCKICAHFLHISNLHSIYTPREDTVRYILVFEKYANHVVFSCPISSVMPRSIFWKDMWVFHSILHSQPLNREAN